MAAATAKYYLRFRIYWCHCCLQKVKVCQQTKFRRDISIDGWDITTSGFEIQTSAILECYFRFRSRPFLVIGVSFCIRLPNFVQIGTSTAELWRHIDFQDGGRQPCCIYFGVMADHPRSAFRVLNSDTKRTVLGRKHVIWAIQRNDQCDCSTSGQDREKNSIAKKVTRVLYFPYLGRSLRWADSTLKLHGEWCLRHNHVCRVSNWNLHGLRFYRGSNFRFSYWF